MKKPLSPSPISPTILLARPGASSPRMLVAGADVFRHPQQQRAFQLNLATMEYREKGAKAPTAALYFRKYMGGEEAVKGLDRETGIKVYPLRIPLPLADISLPR